MNALDYAYEWLELTLTERGEWDEDTALINAFVAGFEAAQPDNQYGLVANPHPKEWECGEDYVSCA
uniref:Uncharacterized protein n=1 Tax=viral metagenome TaxID=1070528 RepID=A0A6M3K9C0_9ZZZZ